jgi:hypothetical protein
MEGTLSVVKRPKLAPEETRELLLVRREDDLSTLSDSSQRVDETEHVDVIHVLHWVIEQRAGESGRVPKVESQEQTRRQCVQLRRAKKLSGIAIRAGLIVEHPRPNMPR